MMFRASTSSAAHVRSLGAWIAFTIVTSLFICAAVVALHLSQNRALERSTQIIRDFDQARIDLYEGLLHVTLGDGTAAPWQRAAGLALLDQALREFRHSLARMPERSATERAFAARLHAFQALLSSSASAHYDPRRAVELRAAFHRLDEAAGSVDAHSREQLFAIRGEQQRKLLIFVGIAAALLALVSAAMIWTARRRLAAETAGAAALRQAKIGFECFEKIFNASPVATNIIGVDDGRFVAVNDAYCRLFGYTRGELVGRRSLELGLWADPAQREAVSRQLVAERQVSNSEMRFRLRSGEIRDGLVSAELIEFLERPCILAIVSDITERKRYEARIEYLATHDGLTDLPNRNLIQDRIEQAIAHAKHVARPLALMFLDLDRFKVLNDGFGHAFGNAVLRAVGERLARTVREGDTVARPYGDEFLVLLTDLRNAADAGAVAKKILEALKQPVSLDGRETRVSASIGVSLFPQDGANADTLIGNADAAMYRAKKLGGGTYQFCSREVTEETRARITLETHLGHALEQSQLHLEYHARVSLATGHMEGCEALVRWTHPELGVVSPGRFIPVAEESGMIVAIGDWVLRTACAHAKAWCDRGLAPTVVSVNISARQFLQKDLAAWVLEVLEDTGLAPQLLELELTESLIAQDTDRAIATVNALKAKGVKFSIDDFGTGYSSLAKLTQFRTDALKIDQSFVRNMLVKPDDATIATAVISLGQSLGMAVVAEGVETAEQCRFLRERGCDAIQGYYFSRPVPESAFASMLAEGRSLAL